MKKIISLLLLFAISLTLLGCSSEDLSNILNQIYGKNPDDGEPCTHIDSDLNGICDKCNFSLGYSQENSSDNKEEKNDSSSSMEADKIPLEPEYGDYDSETESVNVTLVLNNGRNDEAYSVELGGRFNTPPAPTMDNFVFVGWYVDAELTTPYDFAWEVTEEITLYAKWVPDIIDIGNIMATEVVLSTLQIENYKYTSNYIGITTASSYSYGSGVIFAYSRGYYYCLTNNHVVEKGTYAYNELSVYDVYGNSYNAEFVVASSMYDLAVLRIKTATVMSIATFAQSDPGVGDIAISVGNPDGVINSVTYGVVTEYKQINDSTGELKVNFDVCAHNAPIAHGSSGGAVFNTSFEVIGINFAGNTNSQGVVTEGYFIPISRVVEFLNDYLYANAA